MGAVCSSDEHEHIDHVHSIGGVAQPLPPDVAELPVLFRDILTELSRHRLKLGGVRNFSSGYPVIQGKVKAEQFKEGYTDYEYVYLTVLGLARLQLHRDEIIRRCNGMPHNRNPGVQLLELKCGMTMHGDRPGAEALLRSAPDTLAQAFTVARQERRGGTLGFFKDAFDRKADPCLEGRVGRICEYVEKHGFVERGTQATPPWEDVSLKPLSDAASVDDVVGEHLRVFVNECTWRWVQRKRGVDYEVAKRVRQDDAHADEFARLCNAATFRKHMRARGVVAEAGEDTRRLQWEAQGGGAWEPYEPSVNAIIEEARLRGEPTVACTFGPAGWRYEIDLRQRVQRNPKTGKERKLRCLELPLGPPAKRKLSYEELDASIKVFVEDLLTLPPAP